jgi:7-cyano-7-deazaguanine synthase
MEKRRAVVLLSGGIDSATTLAVARSEGYGLYALSFDYNQRHKRELESARAVASVLGVEKHLIIKFDLKDIGGSALTSDMEVPKRVKSKELRVTSTEKDSSLITHHSSSIPVTYVPARNTIFLSFALAWAEVLEAEDIFIGANAIDYSGYPDCRPGYLWAFEDMANLATKAAVEGRLRFMIKAPLLLMKKSEIIKKGAELGFDYSLTWSCYDPQSVNPPLHTDNPPSPPFRKGGKGGFEREGHGEIDSSELIPCGLCDSCMIRAEGFREAGIKDPLIEP